MTNEHEDAMGQLAADLIGEGETPAHRSDFWAALTDELETTAPDGLATASGTSHVAEAEMTLVDTTAVPKAGRSWGPLSAVAAVAALVVAIAGFWFLTGDNGDEPTTTAVAGNSDQPASGLAWVSDNKANDALAPVMIVEGDGPNFWRLGTLTQFDGETWQAPPADEVFFQPAASEPVASFYFVDGVAVPNTSGERDIRASVQVVDPLILNDAVPAPLETQHVDAASPLDLDGNSRIWRVQAGADLPASYEIATRRNYDPNLLDQLTWESIENDAFTTEVDGETVEFLTTERSLPNSVDSDWLREQATTLGGTVGSPAELARALEDTFRTDFRLDPSSTVGPGIDGIESLLATRSGSAEQFASAYASIMRAHGLPARLVWGFGPGETVVGDRPTNIIRAADAHVWVEVSSLWSWTRFDPTPGIERVQFNQDRPRANQDHWHAVYGVWDCRTDSWAPAFQGTLDPLGIHSHQDGLIHIHPFFEAAAGKNAVFGLFLESMELDLSADGLTSTANTFSLPATADCGGQEAVLHLRYYNLILNPDAYETAQIDELADVQFRTDRMGFELVLAPLGAELPDLPAERELQLDSVAPAITSGN